jgi:hypothetical protein
MPKMTQIAQNAEIAQIADISKNAQIARTVENYVISAHPLSNQWNA